MYKLDDYDYFLPEELPDLMDTSLKERFTTLSNKNPPERERFKGNLSTYKMCLGVPNHSYLPIDRMTLLLALSTTEESSRAK